MRKILSIDGGGIRGIIPAMVLSEIEKRTKKPVCELFDLIAGTSTGGILALGLTKPNGGGSPAYSAGDMLSMYEKHGEDIFHCTLWRKYLSYLLDSKYSSEGIEKVLEEYFGKSRLSEALTDIIITSYETEKRMPFFFTSRDARDPGKKELYDHPIVSVARATSAAPTYFEPFKMPTRDKNFAGHYTLIDGGVFANNPAVCGYSELRANHPDEGDFLMVSIGTGEYTKKFPYKEVSDWGKLEWAIPILDIVFDGVSDTVSYQMEQILPDNGGGRRYYRFQATLDEEDSLDDVTPENIARLRDYGKAIIAENGPLIEELCAALL